MEGQTLLSFFGCLLFFSDWFLLAIFYSAGFSGSGGGVLHFFSVFMLWVICLFCFCCFRLFERLQICHFFFFRIGVDAFVRFFFFFLQLFTTTNSFFFVAPILIRL